MQTLNPFSSEEGPIVSALVDCIHIKLKLERSGSAARPRVVAVRNECRDAVAIPATPTELRVRTTQQQVFPEQTLLTAAQSMCYVAPASVGLSGDMFFGYGRKLVYGEPRYSAVPAGTQRPTAILGANRLFARFPGGEVIVALETMVVPVSSEDRSAEAFNLNLGVDELNRGAKRDIAGLPFRLSRRVQQVTATATF
ncbi:MAG TPA: hypothetical protein VF911_19160 [Thermoanaerobaculia bacterium]